ncbi:hypothetical protein TpMuguga_02g00739 [Theileria parva strain Muguga]|uniref:Uncharacterized protein n=1 Tax=Theileria parva TaxID=5875 RepID=Q4N4A0_THEPA|nr:uncharacterized protein TpMuguga_02g00739 [Theileria parva strain Muguga]EAN33023.1 hypothetical protein TpMuguga_02g00739 [Theileria parva strain Muguga]|eukprot:XP_765306.1 hypothetical protein [Theileria parva strain Muguga]
MGDSTDILPDSKHVAVTDKTNTVENNETSGSTDIMNEVNELYNELEELYDSLTNNYAIRSNNGCVGNDRPIGGEIPLVNNYNSGLIPDERITELYFNKLNEKNKLIYCNNKLNELKSLLEGESEPEQVVKKNGVAWEIDDNYLKQFELKMNIKKQEELINSRLNNINHNKLVVSDYYKLHQMNKNNQPPDFLPPTKQHSTPLNGAKENKLTQTNDKLPKTVLTPLKQPNVTPTNNIGNNARNNTVPLIVKHPQNPNYKLANGLILGSKLKNLNLMNTVNNDNMVYVKGNIMYKPNKPSYITGNIKLHPPATNNLSVDKIFKKKEDLDNKGSHTVDSECVTTPDSEHEIANGSDYYKFNTIDDLIKYENDQYYGNSMGPLPVINDLNESQLSNENKVKMCKHKKKRKKHNVHCKYYKGRSSVSTASTSIENDKMPINREVFYNTRVIYS